MKEAWKSLFENKRYLVIWVLTLLFTLIKLKMVSLYLCFNETRTNGYLLNDYVLEQIGPKDMSTLLFTITWICILGSLPIVLRTPDRAYKVFLSIISIGFFRCIMLYFVPLEVPNGIIPLRDPLLEGSFYDSKILVKDLFFSGHTSNMALLTFLMDIKWLKKVLAICTLIVAYLLLVQHVHYTIDVVAAPFFAYLAYRIADKISDFAISVVGKKDVIQVA